MQKDIILFVNAVRPATFDALRMYKEQTGRSFEPVVIVDRKIQTSITEQNGQKQHAGKVQVIAADFDSAASVQNTLRPYIDRIFAVTSQYENSILELKKLIPYLPYLPVPSEKCLDWATEKKLMREVLEAYDSSLVPKYTDVSDSSEMTLDNIEESMSYPLVVKPSGLEGSLLVGMVNNRLELHKTLNLTFQEIQNAYDTWVKRQKPAVLVEEFMEGDMYSIDTYVSSDGVCRHTPVVKVVTGKKIGFDDFFGYMSSTPADLSEAEDIAAKTAAEQACHALGLRSITAHTELMKTADGWKIVELGPRIGGYRHDIYSLSYGINHIMNDILNRAGETPVIPDISSPNPTAAFNIYAPEEGVLKAIDGLDELQGLNSFVWMRQVIQIGEPVKFAKNNGDRTLEVILSNNDPQQFEKDVQRLEECVNITVATEAYNQA